MNKVIPVLSGKSNRITWSTYIIQRRTRIKNKIRDFGIGWKVMATYKGGIESS